MPEIEPQPLFDYTSLDSRTSEFLKSRAAEVKGLMRQTVETLIKTGNILIEVKKRLPHGQWLNWCESEFGWTSRTAHRMINVAESFSADTLSNLDIATSALYILSAPSTPDEAREEALFLARKGQAITYAGAKELREQHRSKTDIKPKQEIFTEGKDPEGQRLLDLKATPAPLPPLITPPPAELEPAEVKQTTGKLTEETKAKTGKRERLKKSPDQQAPDLKIDKSLITSKAKTVEVGQTWRLGGFHVLFCGEPTDPRFIKRLPRNVALLLEFPLSYEPLPKSFVDNFKSRLSFNTTLHDDFDLNVIREALEIILEGTTDGGDAVVLYRLPDSAIFLLLDQLECIAYCAEPDPNKCNAAIAAWTTVTKRAASRT